MLTSYALSIEFHIILVIVLVAIKVLYFHYTVQITSYVYDLCFIYQYHFISFYMFHACIFERSRYEKELYVPEGTITVRDSDLYLYFTV